MTAARARSRCASISDVNVSTSTSTPFSAAISAVSSKGKPYVSCSAKATRPSSLPPGRASAASSVSRKPMPWRSVAPKRSSSLLDDADDQLAVLDDLGVGLTHRAR